MGFFFLQFFSVLCAKWDCRDSFYYYPPLIGPQPLTQSVRPSNALHHLIITPRLALMMCELRGAAVQDTHSKSGEYACPVYACVYLTQPQSQTPSLPENRLLFLTALVAQVIAGTEITG